LFRPCGPWPRKSMRPTPTTCSCSRPTAFRFFSGNRWSWNGSSRSRSRSFPGPGNRWRPLTCGFRRCPRCGVSEGPAEGQAGAGPRNTLATWAARRHTASMMALMPEWWQYVALTCRGAPLSLKLQASGPANRKREERGRDGPGETGWARGAMGVFELDQGGSQVAEIKVGGEGGGGNNAVNRMSEANLQAVEFIARNTDAQALMHCNATYKVQLGE